jgi:N-acetyl-anhydromuramyl-L-alanine amidase AmpD
MSLDLSKIKQVPMAETQYFKQAVPKHQIVLHHTAGNSSGVATIQNWNTDDRGRIATCVTISGPGNRTSPDGEICQAFGSQHWAYHLGVRQEVFRAWKVPFSELDKHSIGIEICNWGQLEFKDGKYINYVNREIPADQVTTLDAPYKGFRHFHRYSDAQIQSVKDLLLFWKTRYKIDLTFNYDQLFTVNTKALRGENGLYTHNSYRRDKIDIYPCPRMISMLKTL